LVVAKDETGGERSKLNCEFCEVAVSGVASFIGQRAQSKGNLANYMSISR
jgi:hypothetical protein